MRSELEKYFGCAVRTEEVHDKLSLPIFMAMRRMILVELAGISFVLVDVANEPELTVSAMKKQREKYEKALNCPVAYQLKVDSLSLRNAMIKNGVAFVDLPGNVFLPFLGIVLQDVYRKAQVKIDKMMPATQMVFLQLLYLMSEEGITKSEAAERLNLTKTSVTRATAQLEAMGLIMQEKAGVEIRIKRNYPRREYFERGQDYLINPVQKTVTVMRNEVIWECWKAGETALSLDSSLNSPPIEEIAIYKGDERVDQFEYANIRYEDWDDCMKVQLWKYNPCYFARDGKVDPVSLICSFQGNTDERIEMCLEEILEGL